MKRSNAVGARCGACVRWCAVRCGGVRCGGVRWCAWRVWRGVAWCGACEPLTNVSALSCATQSIGAEWPRKTACDSSAT